MVEEKGNCACIGEIIRGFDLEENAVECIRFGSGHINDTFRLLRMEEGEPKRYILQRINRIIFRDVDALMKNVSGVTAYLRRIIEQEGGDPERETLNLVEDVDGKLYRRDSQGEYWRVYHYIEGAATYDEVKEPEDFYQSGKAFGRFRRLLSGYPVEKLTDTIPDFHNTPKRYDNFLRAVEQDACGRVEAAAKEIAFVKERAGELGIVMEAIREGRMPQRVTHNDTKLNNIMIDDETRQAICVIDLDTIMPGASVFDYGDSIRFGANTAAEDECDLSKVSLSLPLFDIYTKGYLEGCAGSLTEEETRLLPMGAKLMTLECGMRFLTDYLEGDTYFKIHRENHNLDRCRCQFALVQDMERKWRQMAEIVAKY